MTVPLAIDLYSGLGGWATGLMAEGWRVVGFDIERHVYGEHKYPAQLVVQDVLTIHGSQFKDAQLIVASPPCQEYSYMSMPWSLAKRKQTEYEDGTRNVKDLTALFDACFRIQREACEAAVRHVPMVVENVRGAQKWVGRAKWNFGSFYLWGDVPALMPIIKPVAKIKGQDWNRFKKSGEVSPHWRMEATKGGGGSWFGNYSEGIKQGGDSSARKAASAQIAKIPEALSRHIARVYWPK